MMKLKFILTAVIALMCSCYVSAQNALELTIKASEGDANAMYDLGYYYYLNSANVYADEVFPVIYWKKATDKQHKKAAASVAWCYENGFGIERNSEQAEIYRNKAKEFGLSENEINALYSNLNQLRNNKEARLAETKRLIEQAKAEAQLRREREEQRLQTELDSFSKSSTQRYQSIRTQNKAIINNCKKSEIQVSNINEVLGIMCKNTFFGEDEDKTMAIYIGDKTDINDEACRFNGKAMWRTVYGINGVSDLHGEAWVSNNGIVRIKMELEMNSADVEFFGTLEKSSGNNLYFEGDLSIGRNGSGSEEPVSITFYAIDSDDEAKIKYIFRQI